MMILMSIGSGSGSVIPAEGPGVGAASNCVIELCLVLHSSVSSRRERCDQMSVGLR